MVNLVFLNINNYYYSEDHPNHVQNNKFCHDCMYHFIQNTCKVRFLINKAIIYHFFFYSTLLNKNYNLPLYFMANSSSSESTSV